MKTKQQKIMEAADIITGHAPRLTDAERLWCKRNEVTPPILRGDQTKVVVFFDEHSEDLSLCRAVAEKFPTSGIITVIFDSADAKL